MQGTSPIEKLKTFFDTDRGVSPVIAVALLILIAIGFAVAIQGVGTDIVDSVQEPPEANIDGNPQADGIILTIESVQNADELRVERDGDDSVDQFSSVDAGQTTTVSYEDGSGDRGTQITVTAINLPEDERIVYSYEIPDA